MTPRLNRGPLSSVQHLQHATQTYLPLLLEAEASAWALHSLENLRLQSSDPLLKPDASAEAAADAKASLPPKDEELAVAEAAAWHSETEGRRPLLPVLDEADASALAPAGAGKSRQHSSSLFGITHCCTWRRVGRLMHTAAATTSPCTPWRLEPALWGGLQLLVAR